MHFKLLLLAAVAALTTLPDAASAQPAEAPYYRPRYDDGYRGPPPPPPPGYYEDRRYYRERRPEYYRESPPVYRERPRRGGGIFCAQEGQFCQFQGPAIVRYGAAGRYVRRQAVNGIPCTNQAFGDPAVGLQKACYID